MTDDLDHTRRYKLAGAIHRGRRKPGLSSDVLGWPWHPRRLATARYRGQHGGRDADAELAQGRPAAADLSAPRGPVDKAVGRLCTTTGGLAVQLSPGNL